MIPSHLHRLIGLSQLAMEMIEREDVPSDIRLRLEQVLGLQEKATRYTPPESPFREDVRAEVE